MRGPPAEATHDRELIASSALVSLRAVFCRDSVTAVTPPPSASRARVRRMPPPTVRSRGSLSRASERLLRCRSPLTSTSTGSEAGGQPPSLPYWVLSLLRWHSGSPLPRRP